MPSTGEADIMDSRPLVACEYVGRTETGGAGFLLTGEDKLSCLTGKEVGFGGTRGLGGRDGLLESSSASWSRSSIRWGSSSELLRDDGFSASWSGSS